MQALLSLSSGQVSKRNVNISTVGMKQMRLVQFGSLVQVTKPVNDLESPHSDDFSSCPVPAPPLKRQWEEQPSGAGDSGELGGKGMVS